MWLAEARYQDGSSIAKLFEDDPETSDADQRADIEEWLVTRHEDCIWYSVIWTEKI